jgi:hypothetical protein
MSSTTVSITGASSAIGANKPRALALTGRLADGWVIPFMNECAGR